MDDDNIAGPWNGTPGKPYQYIQDGIDAAVDGDTVIVLDGIYTGTRNKNLDFNGKAITVTSQNGPESTIIDCEESGRGVYFHSDEGPDSGIMRDVPWNLPTLHAKWEAEPGDAKRVDKCL